jgi:protein-tyrosine phosphatase
MGGHYWTDPAGELRLAVVDREFDLVVSLFRQPGHGPATGVAQLVCEVPDEALTADQLAAVQRTALATAAAVRDGRKVLVRCHSGYNRSGLVVAQVLVDRGLTPAQAVELIRRQRSPWALNNPLFVQYLETGLDVARLLSGLGQ